MPRLRAVYGDEVAVAFVYVAAAVQTLEDTDNLFLVSCVDLGKFQYAAHLHLLWRDRFGC